MNAGKTKVLVVDDVEINRIILKEILSPDHQVELAADGINAISNLINSIEKPHLILLDIMMPGMDGFEVLKFIKSDPILMKIPVIFITAANEELKGLRAGAVDYISKPFEPDIVKLRVANHIELCLYRDKLEGLVKQKARELVATKELFLETIANLIEYRCFESSHHVSRTRELANILMRQLLKTGKYCEELMAADHDVILKAVPLHDIGKIGIPEHILLKPGKLTDEEFQLVKKHTIIGSQVVESLASGGGGKHDDYLKHCYEICRYHHERWDGLGYPDGLAGTTIPLSARIVSVVDVYDALVSERCYKKALSHEAALETIQKASGNQLDAAIVSALMEVQKHFKDYANAC